MLVEALFELFRATEQLLRLTEYLAFHVELVSMDLQLAVFRALNDEAESLHVGFDLVHCCVDVVDVVCFTECSQVGPLLVDASLHLEDVEERLSTDLGCMRTKKNVGGSFIRHLVSKFGGKLKVEVLEECFGELGEAVRVDLFLLHDDWKCDLRKGSH